MVDRKKIQAWIKEIEQRPSSAALILNYIGNRLEELTSKNEELQAEIFALQSGNRVGAYENKIAHLEYQIDLLKRQGFAIDPESSTEAHKAILTLNNSKDFSKLLIYDSTSRVAKLDFSPNLHQKFTEIGQLTNIDSIQPETFRIVSALPNEELLFVFDSGRVATVGIEKISLAQAQLTADDKVEKRILSWDNVGKPINTNGGEHLSCISSFSQLPFSDYFFLISRRGYSKKIRTSMANSIISNHYIGTSIQSKPDCLFTMSLVQSDEKLVVMSQEGFLLGISNQSIPVSLEEIFKLNISDHVVAFMKPKRDEYILVMTNIGKTAQIMVEQIEMVNSIRTRGQGFLSTKRKNQGVRVIGAVAARDEDMGIVIDQFGNISAITIGELADAGTLPNGIVPIAFAVISSQDRSS